MRPFDLVWVREDKEGTLETVKIVAMFSKSAFACQVENNQVDHENDLAKALIFRLYIE